MVILGADLHKRWHTVVAVERDRPQARREDDPRRPPDGHLELRRWARPVPRAPLGARGLPPPLAAPGGRPRCASGESVVRVPPKLMAGVRRSVPRARQERPDRRATRSPRRRCASPTCRSRRSTARSASCACSSTIARTSSPSAPGTSSGCAGTCSTSASTEPGPRSLDRAVVLAGPRDPRSPDRARARGPARPRHPGPGARPDARPSGRSSARSRRSSASSPRPCSRLPGCGPLTAAKIVGEAAGISRFRSKEAFARHNGSRPGPGLVGQRRAASA